MMWWEIMTAAGLAMAQSAEARAASDPIVTIRDYAEDSTLESEGWATLLDIRQRVRLPDSADRDTFVRLLAAASENRVALRMRLDTSAARLSADGTAIEYPLCAIAAPGGASFGDEARNCPPTASGRPGAVRLLAAGIIQVIEDHEAGRRTLAEALASSPALPIRAQAIAHNFRGEAAEALTAHLDLTDPAYDRLMAAALADYRRWLALMPNEAAAHFAVARAFLMLGGYDEALRIYQDIGSRWPEEAFDVAIRTGALYRQRADYSRALRQLDDYARDHPVSAAGMRFSYHRAWTLTLLDRFAEAEQEIENGFASQPDYSSAYQLRACIRARLGRLPEALADQQRALQLLTEIMSEPTAAIREDIDRSREVIEVLRRAIDARQQGPMATPCEIFWDRWVRPRQRSALLVADEVTN